MSDQAYVAQTFYIACLDLIGNLVKIAKNLWMGTRYYILCQLITLPLTVKLLRLIWTFYLILCFEKAFWENPSCAYIDIIQLSNNYIFPWCAQQWNDLFGGSICVFIVLYLVFSQVDIRQSSSRFTLTIKKNTNRCLRFNFKLNSYYEVDV